MFKFTRKAKPTEKAYQVTYTTHTPDDSIITVTVKALDSNQAINKVKQFSPSSVADMDYMPKEIINIKEVQ